MIFQVCKKIFPTFFNLCFLAQIACDCPCILVADECNSSGLQKMSKISDRNTTEFSQKDATQQKVRMNVIPQICRKCQNAFFDVVKLVSVSTPCIVAVLTPHTLYCNALVVIILIIITIMVIVIILVMLFLLSSLPGAEEGVPPELSSSLHGQMITIIIVIMIATTIVIMMVVINTWSCGSG